MTVDDGDVVRGQTFTVTAEVWNQSPEPVGIDDVALHAPEGWTVELKDGAPGNLEGGRGITLTYVVTVGRRGALLPAVLEAELRGRPLRHRDPR